MGRALKKPLKILQILPRLDTGGVERGTIDVAHFLKDKGHHPLVISAGGRLCYSLERFDIEHITLPVDTKNPFRIWWNHFKIARVIRQHQVDIVHARSRAPAWSSYFACKKTGTSFVTTFHGTYNFSNGIKKAYNAVMTYGKKVIAPSQFIKNHIKEHYLKNTKKVTVVSRGVHMEKFDPALVDTARLKRISSQFQIPLDKKIILLPGRITRWKGHHVLLEALTYLKERDDFICLFLGSIHPKNRGYYEELQAFIEANDLTEKVQILQENDDMPSFYKMAHVVVSASIDPEAFGRIMSEAGALGTPVIASDHGGAQEIIAPKETGWLYAPGDSETLAGHLDHVLSMPLTQYKTMSRKAVDRVRMYFTNDQMMQKTLSVYQSLV